MTDEQQAFKHGDIVRSHWTVVDDYWYVTITDVKLVEKP